MNHLRERVTSFGLIAVVALAIGCESAETSDGAEASDEERIVSAVATFETKGFVRISAAAVPSQHGAAAAVVVWVSEEAEAAYRSVANGTPPAFAEGTIIVKQHVDANGAPDGAATVMAKLGSGYAPASGDWWWGSFDAAGKLADGGVIDFCVQCHEANGFAKNDWVGGIPLTNQTP